MVLVMVFPTWWPLRRIDLVIEAAQGVATGIAVRRRTPLMRRRFDGRAITVAEVAADFVIVSPPDAAAVVVPRCDDSDVALAVAREVGSATAVVVDAPARVAGAMSLGAAIAARLRADGVPVTIRRRGLGVRCDGNPARSGPGRACDSRRGGEPAGESAHRSPDGRGRGCARVLRGGRDRGGGFPGRGPARPITCRRCCWSRAASVSRCRRSGPSGASRQVRVRRGCRSFRRRTDDVAIHITQSRVAPHQTEKTAADSLSNALERAARRRLRRLRPGRPSSRAGRR